MTYLGKPGCGQQYNPVIAAWALGRSANPYIEAQMAPKALYRAPQHHTARTRQIYRLAAAEHDPGDDALVDRL